MYIYIYTYIYDYIYIYIIHNHHVVILAQRLIWLQMTSWIKMMQGQSKVLRPRFTCSCLSASLQKNKMRRDDESGTSYKNLSLKPIVNIVTCSKHLLFRRHLCFALNLATDWVTRPAKPDNTSRKSIKWLMNQRRHERNNRRGRRGKGMATGHFASGRTRGVLWRGSCVCSIQSGFIDERLIWYEYVRFHFLGLSKTVYSKRRFTHSIPIQVLTNSGIRWYTHNNGC